MHRSSSFLYSQSFFFDGCRWSLKSNAFNESYSQIFSPFHQIFANRYSTAYNRITGWSLLSFNYVAHNGNRKFEVADLVVTWINVFNE